MKIENISKANAVSLLFSSDVKNSLFISQEGVACWKKTEAVKSD
jgi:hypothetical protein